MRRSWWMSSVVSLALSMGAVSACGSDSGGSAATTAGSGNGTLPGESLTLLYISDSSGWGVAEAYAVLIEQQLGVPVEIVDWREGGLSLVDAVAHIDRDPATLATADIVVLEGNPFGSGVRDGFGECMNTYATSSPGPYTVDDFAPYQALMEQAVAKILAARDGVPTAVRLTDIYNAAPEMWVDLGLDADCRSIWDASYQAIDQAATNSGAMFVSAYDAYNGPNHDQDPATKGYLRSDGIHPSDAGAAAMAAALDAVGYPELTGN